MVARRLFCTERTERTMTQQKKDSGEKAKQAIAEEFGYNHWYEVKHAYDVGSGISKIIDFESLMDKVLDYQIEFLQTELSECREENERLELKLVIITDLVAQNVKTIDEANKQITQLKQEYAKLGIKFTEETSELKQDLNEGKRLLEELMSLQNGPPLPTYEQDWNKAMEEGDKWLSKQQEG